MDTFLCERVFSFLLEWNRWDVRWLYGGHLTIRAIARLVSQATAHILSLSVLLLLAALEGVKRDLTVAVICIFLMADDTEHLFIYRLQGNVFSDPLSI